MPLRTVSAEQVAEMKTLRAAGLTAAAIGARLGIAESTIRNWWNAGECSNCGAPTDRSCAAGADRCETCSRTFQQSAEWRDARTFWTRDRIIERIRWWVETYGETPAVTDWNPNLAMEKGDLKRCRRAETLIASGQIPWHTNVFNRFGSWNAAIVAAGFAPRAPFNTPENRLRTRRARRARELEAVSTTKEKRSSVG